MLDIVIKKDTPLANVIEDLENLLSELYDNTNLTIVTENYPSLTISGTNTGHTHTVENLSDVDLTGIADGFTLKWDDATSTWKPGIGIETLNDIEDVDVSAPTDKDTLIWNEAESKWESGVASRFTSYSLTITATASQTDFDISSIFPDTDYYNMAVFRNGLLQYLGVTKDYTLNTTSGSEKIVFNSACVEGEFITIIFNVSLGLSEIATAHTHLMEDILDLDLSIIDGGSV